ncbi:MAG: ankyrin repeat domain-containing protein [Wolbachia endosymbiont of Fragariocoptes setiger]|nr:ankyrin repeat domain-containing protein [Wolbachia endosymbiont of Fragariocoptes setiger]
MKREKEIEGSNQEDIWYDALDTNVDTQNKTKKQDLNHSDTVNHQPSLDLGHRSNTIEFLLGDLSYTLKDTKTKSVLSGHQACIDINRVNFIINKKEIPVEYVEDSLNKLCRQITGQDTLPTSDDPINLTIAKNVFLTMFQQAEHLHIPKPSLLEELAINCNQSGYIGALFFQLGHLFCHQDMTMKFGNQRVNIKSKRKNCINLSYTSDIHIHDFNCLEKIIGVMKSQLRFEIALDNQNKPVYRNCKVTLNIPDSIGLLEEIKELYKFPLHVASRNGDVNTVNLLLHNGVDIFQKNCHSLTPLHEAVLSNNTDIVKLIIKHNYEKYKVPFIEHSKDGNTPIMLAAIHGKHDIVDTLLSSKGSLLNLHNVFEEVLQYTVALERIATQKDLNAGHLSCAELIVANLKDLRPRLDVLNLKYIDEPLKIAKRSKNKKFTECIRSLELIEAVKFNDQERIKTLLQKETNMDFQDMHGKTALHYAVDYESIYTLIKAVPKKEISSFLNIIDKNGESIAHIIARHKTTKEKNKEYIQTVKMLLKHGLDIYVENKMGQDSLDVASNPLFLKCLRSLKRYRQCKDLISGIALLGMASTAPLFVSSVAVLTVLISLCILSSLLCFTAVGITTSQKAHKNLDKLKNTAYISAPILCSEVNSNSILKNKIVNNDKLEEKINKLAKQIISTNPNMSINDYPTLYEELRESLLNALPKPPRGIPRDTDNVQSKFLDPFIHKERKSTIEIV